MSFEKSGKFTGNYNHNYVGNYLDEICARCGTEYITHGSYDVCENQMYFGHECTFFRERRSIMIRKNRGLKPWWNIK